MDTQSAGFSRAFLDLLDREATAAEFESPLLAARAAGAGAEFLAELDAARIVALRVRGLLEQRRRREAELAVLFETAGDLAALHDLDSVLRAIVRRARQLLGTDVSYLTLNDPVANDTFMRVTSGSVSAVFQQLRLGIGEGLGGLVAKDATPYTTEDYLADPRFLHTAGIDRGVREEGLVAILGVPLLLRGLVIGVLFAADRRARAFGPAEVSLLCSMAAHVAVAIEAANLLEETRTALADLNAANALLSSRNAEVERASQAHHRFTDIVLAGGTAEDVARAVATVLGGDVVILNEQDALLGSSGKLSPEDPGLLHAAADARTHGRAVRSAGFWTAPAMAASEHLGTLVLRAGSDLPEADRRILERAATVTALLLLMRRSVTEAEHRIRGELLSDLLRSPHRDAASLRARALRLGADLDQPHVLVAAHADPAARTRLRSAAAHLAGTRRGLAAEHDGVTVVMVPGTDAAAAAKDVANVGSAASRHVTAGSAQADGGPEAIVAAYRQARRCLEALLALGRSGESATMAELGFLGLLLSDRKDVPDFIESAVGPLVDYDARNGTELAHTVETYFSSGCNLTRTGQLLHVHVNTVTQRLDRVSRLLGEGWQVGERGLEARVALRLHRLGAQRWAS